MDPEKEEPKEGTPEEPQAPTPTQDAPPTSDGDMPERLRRQREKFDRQLEGRDREWQAKLDEVKRENERMLDELRSKLGIAPAEDPVEIATEKDKRSTLAARRAAFTLEAVAAGIPSTRIDAAFKMIDHDKITISERGEAVGADTVVSELIEKEGWIMLGSEKAKPPVGTPTSPPDSDEPSIDDPDSLKDPEFVRKNAGSILAREAKRLFGR